VRDSIRWASRSFSCLRNRQPEGQLGFDPADRLLQTRQGRHEVARGIDRHPVLFPEDFPRHRVERGQALDFVAEQLDAHALLGVGGTSSTVSPRTRNVPREKSTSLRV